MSITKLLTRAILFVLCFTLSLNFTPILEAGKIPNFKIDPKLEAKLKSESEIQPGIQPTKSKVKPVIKKDKNGKKQIDFEPDIKMTKNQEKEFEKCKTEEVDRRSKRNQNKPTACRKEIRNPDVELIEQDYTVLIDRIQEKNELDKGLDMSLELPLETFIDIKNLVECNDTIVTSSSISSLSSSITSDNTCNSNSSSTSSSSGISDSSTALSSNSSSVLSGTVTSSSQNNSSLTLSSNSPLTSSSKTSLLDFLFPKIEVQAIGGAVGTKVDGYRLPYPSGAKLRTYLVVNDPTFGDTHINRNAFDFGSFSGNFLDFNSDIVAAKGGQVVVSVDTTSGFGKHIVIKQDDGHYAVYGHLSSRTKSVNEVVNRSDKIGVQGQTGNANGVYHLHFEVLNSSVASQTNCNSANVFSDCYSYSNSSNSAYKVTPQFDECFANRGGTDENECKENGVTVGYPAVWQSSGVGKYYTSMNGRVQPPQDAWWAALDFQNSNNGTPVVIQGRNDANQFQLFNFDPVTLRLKNKDGRCWHSGNVNSNTDKYLRMSDCTTNNNQKWKQDGNGRVWSLQPDSNGKYYCIEHGGIYSASPVILQQCNGNSVQKWWFDLSITNGDVPVTKPPVFNNFSGQFIFYGGWQFDVQNYGNVASNGTYEGTPVQIVQSPNSVNNAQKWSYNMFSKEIKGMSDYCLDAGDSQGRLQIWTCNGTNNQKWSIHPNGWIQNQQTGNCISIPNGSANSILKFDWCGATGWQSWNRTNITLPGRVAFRRENTNQCLSSYGPYNQKPITTQDCNNNDSSQQWEWIQTSNGYSARRFGTSYCLDVYNPGTNSAIYSYECNWSDAQKWWYDSSKLLSRTAGNSNGQCAAKWNPQNGNNINAYPCSSNNYNDPNLRWDAYGV